MSDSRDLRVSNENIDTTSLKESDKQTQTKARRGRTKKEQLDLINDFHKNHDEVLDNDTYYQDWNELVVKLNSIGPPNNSSNEWKRVWTEHKYNKKRKQLDAAIHQHEPNQRKSVQHPVTIGQTVSTLADVNIQSNLGSVDPLSEIIDQNLLIMSDICDGGYSNFLLLHNRLLTIHNQPFSDTNSVLDNAHVQPVHSSAPSWPDAGQRNISCWDQQNQMHSIHSQDEIGKNLSEILKKLDVVLDLSIDNNNLLKEFLQKK